MKWARIGMSWRENAWAITGIVCFWVTAVSVIHVAAFLSEWS